MSCHSYVFFEKDWRKILSADESQERFHGCHGQIRYMQWKGGNMSSNITKEQINTTMALALMKHLFNQGKISEKVYKKILSKYEKKGLAESNNSC